MRKELKLVRRLYSWVTVEPLEWYDDDGTRCYETDGLCMDTFKEYFEVPDEVDEIRIVASSRPMGGEAYKVKFDPEGEDFLLYNDAKNIWEWVTVGPGFDHFFKTNFPKLRGYVGVEYD